MQAQEVEEGQRRGKENGIRGGGKHVTLPPHLDLKVSEEDTDEQITKTGQSHALIPGPCGLAPYPSSPPSPLLREHL